MTSPSSTPEDDQSNPRDRRSLSGLNAGYTLVASVLLGLGLGYWLDTGRWIQLLGGQLEVACCLLSPASTRW